MSGCVWSTSRDRQPLQSITQDWPTPISINSPPVCRNAVIWICRRKEAKIQVSVRLLSLNSAYPWKGEIGEMHGFSCKNSSHLHRSCTLILATVLAALSIRTYIQRNQRTRSAKADIFHSPAFENAFFLPFRGALGNPPYALWHHIVK